MAAVCAVMMSLCSPSRPLPLTGRLRLGCWGPGESETELKESCTIESDWNLHWCCGSGGACCSYCCTTVKKGRHLSQDVSVHDIVAIYVHVLLVAPNAVV